MQLGIVVAMIAEARSFTGKTIKTGGRIELKEGAAIQLSGIGAQRAERAATDLLKHGATALLSWGIAGGLMPGLAPGSLVLPKIIIGQDLAAYSTDPGWHERLSRRIEGRVDLHMGPLTESAVVVKSLTEKRGLFERTGAIAVDMESCAVARTAHEARIPFMTIRAVADSSDMSLPQALLMADEFGQIHLPKLLIEIAKNPLELLQMIQLGRGFRAAQATLRRVVRFAGCDLLVS
jgi:adenosylhomocysteine nucleosidase